jgi:pimeloyl-ACP methyl ester carboxylesterase
MASDLAFRRSAGTGRTVVLVHGNSSSSAVWQALLDGPFGQRFRCLAVDLPGHGASARADAYSLPDYAAALADFVGQEEAVLVGWSLGGHTALHAVPSLPQVPGVVIFGTPPVASAASLAEAFRPNPAFGVGFRGAIDTDDAIAYATAMLAPDSSVSPDVFVPDILATDPAARLGLAASIGEGRFADEVRIVAELDRPLLVLHGDQDQLVSLDYLRSLDLPVEVLPGVGHAVQVEAPDLLARRLTDFVTGL